MHLNEIATLFSTAVLVMQLAELREEDEMYLLSQKQKLQKSFQARKVPVTKIEINCIHQKSDC